MGNNLIVLAMLLSLFVGFIAGCGYRTSKLERWVNRKLDRRARRKYWRKLYKSNPNKPGWVE